MIPVDCKQRDGTWFKARCGRPTASRFDCMVTSTGKACEGAKRADYLHELIAESYTGKTEQHFPSAAMERGTLLEPAAREWYELASGNAVVQVGFVYGDKTKRWGCSPDGITNTGGIEIKCPLNKQHVRALLQAQKTGKAPASYAAQIQGNMWICQRQHWDFVLFTDAALPSMILTVQRDDKVCDALAELVPAFIAEVKAGVEKLREI